MSSSQRSSNCSGSSTSTSSSSDTESSDSCESSSQKDQSDISIDGASSRGNAHNVYSTDDPFSKATLQWTISVPIGLGLCPWAIKSHNHQRLRIVTCETEMPSDVPALLEREISSLTCEVDKVAPLSTTLIVCPFTKHWDDFCTFENFVKGDIKRYVTKDVLDKVTLVAFHPNFLKWHALPSDMRIGSTIQSHYGMIGQKSLETTQGTIIEMENRAFGLRKVKVRFNDEIEGSRQEQYVPTDWIDNSNGICEPREPLPDNFMYQTPYPTIHIINNEDLAKLCVRDVSRVKRLNARRMARRGWEGLSSYTSLK
ncbi:hypothetical protein ACHAWO_012608 [Cyclotella atomus]|uniref:Uncharacterized protein n=1 Tax=Cyclotella atomus TaxID=382360 RepID=A0ABD3PXP0_9STRA